LFALKRDAIPAATPRVTAHAHPRVRTSSCETFISLITASGYGLSNEPNNCAADPETPRQQPFSVTRALLLASAWGSTTFAP
jgi:hypothetical protein